jgi:hypothetical protein
MTNSILDATWSQLRERVLARLHEHHAAGRPVPSVELDIEPISHTTGRIVARLSDGSVMVEDFSIVDATVEHLQSTGASVELTPQIAERIGELRTADNIASVRVLKADVQQALVVVTPRHSEPAAENSDWSRPTEPFLLAIPAGAGATVQ